MNKKILTFFWSQMWKNPLYLFGMIVSDILASVAFRIVPPIYAAIIIRRLASGDYTPGDYWTSFGHEITVFAVSMILGGVVLKRVELLYRFKLEMNVEQRIKTMMHDKYLELDTGFHADNFSGSLTNRVSKLTTSYIRFADSVVHPTVQMLTVIVSIYIVVFSISLPFLTVFSLIAASFVFAALKLGPPISTLFVAKSKIDNESTGLLADVVGNIIAVKSFSSEEDERKLYRKSTEKSKRTLHKAGIAVFWRDLLFGGITTVFQIGSLLVAVVAIVEQNANLATVFLLLTYANTLVDQLFFFGTATINNIDRVLGDAEEGIRTLDREPKVKDVAKPLSFSSVRGAIEFKNVTFDHNDDEDGALFDKLNLRIKPGEKIGLVGHSGGGKSTLTKLIMRLMDIDKGEILIDGQDIAKVRQIDLRQYLSYVPQEPIMFHRSLAENISYGRRDATKQEIEAAAKMAHAHDFITSLPEGYETMVGERGVKLSGGQRQRVAIARAMLKNAPILLLDEATSALDSESESLIQDALWKLIKNKTAIVIAHRLSTIQQMDRILVLENGEIVEEGSHNELIHNDGIYAELWKHQSGGFLED